MEFDPFDFTKHDLKSTVSNLNEVPDYKVSGTLTLSLCTPIADHLVPNECSSIVEPSLGYFTYQKKDSSQRGCFAISKDCEK